MNEEKAIEHLSILRHRIKRALGDYIIEVESKHGRIDDLNDGTILAALTSVLCEMLHTCGEKVDDDFIERFRATYEAVVLARRLTEQIMGEIPMPTTTVQ